MIRGHFKNKLLIRIFYFDLNPQNQIFFYNAGLLYQLDYIKLTYIIFYKQLYDEYVSVFGIEKNLCPEFHSFFPGLHPHQCVSYHSNCKGVTKVEVRYLEESNFPLLCHPNVIPDRMNFDIQYQYPCGQNRMLIITLSSSSIFKYECNSNSILPKCFVYFKLPNFSGCQYCKNPYYGFDCQYTYPGYDPINSFDKPLKCGSINCLSCEVVKGDQSTPSRVECTKCAVGYSNQKTPIPNYICGICKIQCVIFQECQQQLPCEQSDDGSFQYKQTCYDGQFFNQSYNQCWDCPDGCKACYFTNGYRSCVSCFPGYTLRKYKATPQNIYYCFTSFSCLTEYGYIQFSYHTQQKIKTLIKMDTFNINIHVLAVANLDIFMKKLLELVTLILPAYTQVYLIMKNVLLVKLGLDYNRMEIVKLQLAIQTVKLVWILILIFVQNN